MPLNGYMQRLKVALEKTEDRPLAIASLKRGPTPAVQEAKPAAPAKSNTSPDRCAPCERRATGECKDAHPPGICAWFISAPSTAPAKVAPKFEALDLSEIMPKGTLKSSTQDAPKTRANAKRDDPTGAHPSSFVRECATLILDGYDRKGVIKLNALTPYDVHRMDVMIFQARKRSGTNPGRPSSAPAPKASTREALDLSEIKDV